jgi:hypothetical protein
LPTPPSVHESRENQPGSNGLAGTTVVTKKPIELSGRTRELLLKSLILWMHAIEWAKIIPITNIPISFIMLPTGESILISQSTAWLQTIGACNLYRQIPTE